MKTTFSPLPSVGAAIVWLLFSATSATATEFPRDRAADQRAATDAPVRDAISWAKLGAQVGAQYQGDGLSIRATEDGARLWCVFQKLEGHATAEGLWLVSTDTGQRASGGLSAKDGNDRFRVVAKVLGRENRVRELRPKGLIRAHSALARFTRPGVIEEYSVSADGVRQDFVITQPPAGDGRLLLELEVAGAQAEQAPQGARLVLPCGRRIAYSRLHVTDATGRELPARIEVGYASLLRVFVDDAKAAYPIRIDPTFSDDNWIGMGGIVGLNHYGESVATDPEGNLYVGGLFTAAGNVAANGIVKWNGAKWEALGSGITGDFVPGVHSLLCDGTNLFAGGEFSYAGGLLANNIAVWNGLRWEPLGSGVNGQVSAMAKIGGDLFVGGWFTEAGGNSANRIARWNGIAWHPLGMGTGGVVDALVAYGDELIVGGINSAGGLSVDGLAKWDGTEWKAFESWAGGNVRALAVGGGQLYVAGNLRTGIGLESKYSVSAWNGSAWNFLGGEFGSVIENLGVVGDSLFAGGWFDSVAGVHASGIARWNGSSWEDVGNGVDQSFVAGIVGLNEVLFATGRFNTAGGREVNYISAWDGERWEALSPDTADQGLDFSALASASIGTELYVAGSFTSAGALPANHIARWDGSNWSSVGNGVDGSVHAIVEYEASLVAGGSFLISGGMPVNRVARWDGVNWLSMGTGIGGPPFSRVTSLEVFGSELYAGGDFTNAVSEGPSYLARWNGSTWNGVGDAANSRIWALAADGGYLFAGGDFTRIGNLEANRVARWNGQEWAALGGGREGNSFASVKALRAVNGILYVGGTFSTAGGQPVRNIAKWNGSAWTSLGLGLGGTETTLVDYDGAVRAISAYQDNIFVGGDFTASDAISLRNLACWDGRQWISLGSGVDGNVYSLSRFGPEIFVCGQFVTGGGHLSVHAARFVPASGVERTLELSSHLEPGSALVSWPTSSVPFQLESATVVGNVPGEWELVTTPAVVENGTNRITVPNAGSQFFRLKYP